MKKILILGAGMIGAPMAIDLAKDGKYEIIAADINDRNLDRLADYNIGMIKSDLTDKKELKSLIDNCDYVLNAVPGFMGFETLRTVIENGKDVVDIAFYGEDPFFLDDLAKRKNVTAIVDCGFSPGISNILIGRTAAELDEIDSILIYVGGLPQKREGMFEYKIVFSVTDLIEEYIRPARFIEDGKLMVKPALSDLEPVEFEATGTLEAFNSDGLRTVMKTIKAPNLKEKTLRYPGHVEKILTLREAGFFSKEEITLNGSKVVPFDMSAKILSRVFGSSPGDKDVSVLRVIIEGRKNSKKTVRTFELTDFYDEETATNSMARTTGYTATMAMRLLESGLFRQKGISPPEFIGREKPAADFILRGLEERGIRIKEIFR